VGGIRPDERKDKDRVKKIYHPAELWLSNQGAADPDVMKVMGANALDIQRKPCFSNNWSGYRNLDPASAVVGLGE
jgi:hypothetical protein